MINLPEISKKVKPHILEAGKMIMKSWKSGMFTSQLKDERDLVTETDVLVENYLKTYLNKILPEAGFIVEEGITEKKSEFNWTIDPIDGTKYFATKAPLFFTQIALLQNDKPVLSFVYQPIADQLFSAVKGRGAYLNGAMIPPRIFRKTLDSAIDEFDLTTVNGEKNRWKLSLFEKIGCHVYRPRFSGGYFNLYLITGTIDASIKDIILPYSVKNAVDLHPHDLLLSEAGYSQKIVPFEGHSILIRSSEELISQLSKLIL